MKAALAGVIANVILGASSLYWKAFGEISPQALLCYRILISLVTFHN
jgi:chloramphenicol-sensitive protein RarD